MIVELAKRHLGELGSSRLRRHVVARGDRVAKSSHLLVEVSGAGAERQEVA